MIRIIHTLLVLITLLVSFGARAESGTFFNIVESGQPTSVDILLCLNAKGPSSCQTYHVSAENLEITTTINRYYPLAGIKILTPGYQGLGCTLDSTGFCLFAASNTRSTSISLNPTNPINKTVPEAPSNVTAIPGNASATVSWTAPNDGGSPITSYTVTTSPAEGSCTVTGTTANCTGLTNGTAYSFSVFASNAVGNGPSSPNSTPVTPATVPDRPTNASATAGNASATVTWTAPANDGGSPITGYIVTPSPVAGSCAVTGTTANCTGLTNGTAYSFSIVASNAIGNSFPSVSSTPVTPQAAVPGIPSNVTATAGNASATVSWTAPSDGGSPITSYTVTASPANGSCAVTGTTANCTGLTNGTSYTFSVFATNAVGDGLSSPNSTPVTPATVPSAPLNVVATAGVASATLTWNAPVSNGGSAILGYTATPSGSSGSCAVTGTTASCTGLTNGNAYFFAVRAANAVGLGSTAISNAVTPSATSVPGPPTNVTAYPGNTTAVVTWTAPTNDGGSPITSYSVISSPSAGASCTVTGTTTATCTNLMNSAPYTISVSANNAIGPSTFVDSNLVTPLPSYTIASQPLNLNVTVGSEQPTTSALTATLTWSPPSNLGNSSIISYSITPYIGSTAQTAVIVDGSITTKTISGLTAGTSYRFVVAAQNATGTGLKAYSTSVTPTSGLVVNPSTLALSGLGNGASRTVTLTNTSPNLITINSVSNPSPALPGNASVTSNSCNTVGTLTPGSSCTITLNPGTVATSSSNCASRTAPTPSVVTITGTDNLSNIINANVNIVVLGYGCQYQGGYLFAIDDTTPTTTSIGGKTFATGNQASGVLSAWSDSNDSIFGIDQLSTTSTPSPSSNSQIGQLNCNGARDGFCNSNNILVFYGTTPSSSAAGVCNQALNGASSSTCTLGSAGCYNDWYFPAICELGSNNSIPCSSANVFNNVGTFSLNFWSSTESSTSPASLAWFQDSFNNSQNTDGKVSPSVVDAVRCARNLTN